jgi:hypothetical protein
MDIFVLRAFMEMKTFHLIIKWIIFSPWNSLKIYSRTFFVDEPCPRRPWAPVPVEPQSPGSACGLKRAVEMLRPMVRMRPPRPPQPPLWARH